MQFNLQLSEKEQNDRAKVVLPFEHQGMVPGLHIGHICVFFFKVNLYHVIKDQKVGFSLCEIFS